MGTSEYSARSRVKLAEVAGSLAMFESNPKFEPIAHGHLAASQRVTTETQFSLLSQPGRQIIFCVAVVLFTKNPTKEAVSEQGRIGAVRLAQRSWPSLQVPPYAIKPRPASRVPCDQATTRDELNQSLSFALRFNGRKRVPDADETIARITAERLVEHLVRSGYVVMHKPPLGQHGAPGNLAGWIEKAVRSGGGE
jgi:hypothetical protein